MEREMELPELPNTKHVSTWKGEQDRFDIYGYTADQMRAYGEQCILLERERAAKVVEALEGGGAGERWAACRIAAEAIRKG
jgi:hypothetical protein